MKLSDFIFPAQKTREAIGLWTDDDVVFNKIRSGDTVLGTAAQINIVSDSATASLGMERYGNPASFFFLTAFGTHASPTQVTANGQFGVFAGSPYHSGGAFPSGANCSMRFVANENQTPTAQGSRIILEATPAGSTTASRTEVARFEAENGISMFGTNIVLDSNRLLRKRVYTVATLPPAGTKGRVALVSDAMVATFGVAPTGGGTVNVPVYDDGTIWRMG